MIGLEITLENSIILLYAKNYKGYQSLIKLSTIQSERQVTIDDIKNNSQEILCIIPFEYKELLNTIRNIVSEIYLGYKNKEEERIVRLDTKNVVFLREVQYILVMKVSLKQQNFLENVILNFRNQNYYYQFLIQRIKEPLLNI